jgi:hypothetical protein
MTLTDPTTSALPGRSHSARLRGSALPTPQSALPHDGQAEQQQTRRLPIDTNTVVPVLDVTVPVYNDEVRLERNLRRLHGYLTDTFPHSFRITVADNASTDNTLRIAERLARELPELVVVRFQASGRGNALRHVWEASPSPVLAYMESDLSTDLAAVAPLLAPLISGHSELAIGTRLARTSRVTRSPLRGFVSRSFNFLLRTVTGARFSDAQCGFKAIRADVAHRLLPHTKDDGWFFDTELLVIAERCGLRVHEVPVDWTDNPDAGVDVVRTALADLRGVARLKRNLRRIPVNELRRELGRVPRTTTKSTPLEPLIRVFSLAVVSLVLFLLLCTVMEPLAAGLLGLSLTAIWATLRIVFRRSREPERSREEGAPATSTKNVAPDVT